MKLKPVLSLAAGILAFAAPARAQLSPCENLSVTSLGREGVRTEFMSYDRRDDATEYESDRSPFYLPLDGKWYFRSAAALGKEETGFFDPEISPDPREADLPGYFAVTSPGSFKGLRPPSLPADQSIGLYRAQFDVPVLWLDREIFVTVGGIKGGMTLYINGFEVGYSEESGVPAEFLISPYVRDGINTIGLALSRYTTGDWIENHALAGAGIEAGVAVWSQPPVHIRDFSVSAQLDSLYKVGTLDLSVEILNRFNAGDTVTVFYDLADASGKIIRYDEKETVVPGLRGRDTLHFQTRIADVRKWSPESPYQYQLMIRVRHQGRFTEYVPYKVGFKKIEWTEAGFLLNGTSSDIVCAEYNFNGIAPDDESIRSAVRQMKSEGYNTLKCTYHPRKNRLYEICAEEGLMIIDQIGIDTEITGNDRSSGGTLGNNPRWLPAYLERTENAWRHSRNHTALIGWSLGGGTGTGYNLQRSYMELKSLDTKLPVASEMAGGEWNSDLIVVRAPFAENIEKVIDGRRSRPLVLRFDGTDLREILEQYGELK